MTSRLGQSALWNTLCRLRIPSTNHHHNHHHIQNRLHPFHYFVKQQPYYRCFSTLFPQIIDFQESNDKNSHKDKGKQKKKKKKSGKPSYRFVDKVRIKATAGNGGKGALSLYRIGRKRKLRPDGGNGGNGGSIVVFADPKEQSSLRMSHHHFQAASGTNGSNQNKHGRKGKNTIIRVPCGVIVKRVLDYDEIWDPETLTVTKINQDGDDDDELLSDYSDEEYDDDDDDDNDALDEEEGDTDDEIDEDVIGFSDWDVRDDNYDNDNDDDHNGGGMDMGDRERVVVADLDTPSSHVVVCRGGRGGLGSGVFASRHGKLPDAKILAKYARPKPGEVAHLELELKLIADIGLVGFPNAGKSSLLCAMSRAAPQVAPYPFTTLNPFVGVIEYQDAFTLKVADIPGLIDGAAEGRGKGHDFLRHIERTKALLYIVDAAGTDGRDPVEDFKILANELASYGDGDMINRQALVVANKLDLLDDDEQEEVLSRLQDAANEMGIQVYGDVLGISAGVTGHGLTSLSEVMRGIVLQSRSQSP